MERNTKVILVLIFVIAVLLVIIVYFSLNKNSKEVEAGINPAKDNPDSKIVIIEFSDFQCPACKNALPMIDEILDEYDVAFYYRNFPLPMHKDSFIAALAAECANEQGKFWQYHDILFENQDKLNRDSLKIYAKNLNLSEEQFNLCLDAEKYKQTIEKDLKNGKALKIQGTPTFFINNKKVLGANKNLMKQIIEEELKK